MAGDKVFVVTMYRWGNREGHSYVLGVWSSFTTANNAGYTEKRWRGGKYEPVVTSWIIDGNEFDRVPSADKKNGKHNS